MAKSKESVLSTELYPVVSKALSKPETVKKVEQIIGRFVDKNAEALSAAGPSKNIMFSEYDKSIIFDILDIEQGTVKSLNNKSSTIKSAGTVMKEPFRSLMAMVIRHFSLNKDEKRTKLTCFYLGLSLYPALFYKYWKYPPNQDVMAYTMSSLSNKFKVKQTGNLMDALVEICYGAFLLHKEDIDKGLDYGVTQFISAIRTRLNSMLKKIMAEFYQNYEEGKYLGTEFESMEEDKYREADSSIHSVARIVDKVSMKLIVNGPPIKLITIAAKSNDVSVNELRNYISTMCVNEKIDDIKQIIEAIVFTFIYDKKYTVRDINSNDFIVYSMEIYRRSNTTDENVLKIKKILDSWLTELDAYRKTQRVATINNFRRAMYLFFVMSIQYYN